MRLDPRFALAAVPPSSPQRPPGYERPGETPVHGTRNNRLIWQQTVQLIWEQTVQLIWQQTVQGQTTL